MNRDGLVQYGPITIVAFGDSVTVCNCYGEWKKLAETEGKYQIENETIDNGLFS